MKIKTKEKRVINIDKNEFDIIQNYCDRNSFKMSKWMARLAVEKINENKNSHWEEHEVFDAAIGTMKKLPVLIKETK